MACLDVCALEQHLLVIIGQELILYRGLNSHSDSLMFFVLHSCSRNEVGQEQWQAIIPALATCTKLKSISDYEWSAQVLSNDQEVNLSRKGLNDKSAMAVLVGLLQREQATRITKLDLRSCRDKAGRNGNRGEVHLGHCMRANHEIMHYCALVLAH